MKNYIFLLIGMFCSVQLMQAQLEKPTKTVIFEAEFEAPTPEPTGLELPKINVPSLTTKKAELPNTRSIGENNPEPLDITKGDGLLDYKLDKGPKFFTKDKVAGEDFGRDQVLGEIRTSRAYLNVVYRDHEAVDGDVVRVFVNEDIVRAAVTLGGSFQGFDLPLSPGVNKVEFQALNQGESGPNTAELHIYDDTGKLISAKEWNLLTGYKATFIIIKE